MKTAPFRISSISSSEMSFLDIMRIKEKRDEKK